MKKSLILLFCILYFMTALKPICADTKAEISLSVNIIEDKTFIRILTEKEVYENGEAILYSFNLSTKPSNFTISYGIEDLAGNIIKEYRNTTNLYQKSYTPSIKSKEQILVLKARLYLQNKLESSAEKIVLVNNSDYQEQNNTSSDGSSEGQDGPDAENTIKARLSYELVDMIKEITVGEKFSNKLKITNDAKKHTFEVWSYVYIGSKCHSGEREENKKTITLEPGSTEVIVLDNLVEEAEAGEYKFKVKIRKDGQKTTNDLTEDVAVISIEDEEANITEEEDHYGDVDQPKQADKARNSSSLNSINQSGNASIVSGTQFYESKAAKIKKSIVYGLLGLLFLVIILLMLKN
jgi:hypothetical protein